MNTKRVIMLSVMCLLVVIAVVGDIVLGYFGQLITNFFQSREWDWSQVAETLQEGDALCREIESEGIVLLKNQETDGVPALPISVAPMPEGENEAEILSAWTPTKINVFGWGASDGGTVAGGSGSGSSTERGNGVKTFLEGLTEGGFAYNTAIMDMCKNFRGGRAGTSIGGIYPFFNLYEPPVASYSALIPDARAFSDTAVVVISRLGGESKDLQYEQHKWYSGSDQNTTADTTRTYLDLSTDEEDMIALVTENFEKVIVVINACNAMNLSFLDDEKIDAAISVGATGQSGTAAIADVLRGKKTVREIKYTTDADGAFVLDGNGQKIPVMQADGAGGQVSVYTRREVEFSPSGKTADTYVYDLTSDPSYANGASNGITAYTTNNGSYVDYVEDIYIGYYYYETAHQLSVGGEYDFDYDKTVQFPFGYGLSYTEFDWEIQEILPARGAQLKKDGTITITVRVENVGERAGKDVVQLYFTAPYTDGGIEKPYVKLCAFAKTALLTPGSAQELTLSFDISDMASYDCYDKNGNGFSGYELDAGAYEVKIQTDAHTLADAADLDAVITYAVPAGGFQYNEDKVIKTDIINAAGTVTGQAERTLKKAENRFTGKNAYSGMPLDGSIEEIGGIVAASEVPYMTRADFAGTFPKAKQAARERPNDAFYPAVKNGWGNRDELAGAVAPVENKAGDLRLFNADGSANRELIMKLGADYDDPLWEDLLNQIPAIGAVTGAPGAGGSGGSLETLIGRGGWETSHVDAIGKPWMIDLDGPSGLNTNIESNIDSRWTGYPVSTVIAQSFNAPLAYVYGLAVGAEAKLTGVSGWYAPAMNTHRSRFAGRNFEYYSEDPFLSGIMGAETVRGALTNGCYTYIKHFAVNDCETGRNGLYTWLTEQALREIYLKPFEISVKYGGANAVMSSFNRVGAVWAGANRALLVDILRDEWGFRGSVLTDFSSGGEFMNVDQGIRNGGDIWLTGIHQMPSGFSDRDSATARVYMRNAGKNILYTLANAYYYSETHEADDERFGVSVAVLPPSSGFPWWIIWGAIPVNIVLWGGAGVLLYVGLLKDLIKKRNKKNGEEENAAG